MSQFQRNSNINWSFEHQLQGPSQHLLSMHSIYVMTEDRTRSLTSSRRGVVCGSITKLSIRLDELEKKLDDPTTLDHACPMLEQLKLDAKFKVHDRYLVGKEDELDGEQNIIDQHDDNVAELGVRLQKLLALCSPVPLTLVIFISGSSNPSTKSSPPSMRPLNILTRQLTTPAVCSCTRNNYQTSGEISLRFGIDSLLKFLNSLRHQRQLLLLWLSLSLCGGHEWVDRTLHILTCARVQIWNMQALKCCTTVFSSGVRLASLRGCCSISQN